MDNPPAKEAFSRQNAFPPVSPVESGQKLIRFLERRLNLPEALLHRWLRTGQIRVNGGRKKPFDKVNAGDVIRLPPFASSLAAQSLGFSEDALWSLAYRPNCGLPPLIGSHNDIWAVNKPAGLPTQSGSGHADSVAARFEGCYSDAVFRPAPCHRLDRDTGGVLLIGASFEALRQVQTAFQQGLIHKEYLTWVSGQWLWAGPGILRSWLRHESKGSLSRMHVYERPAPYAKEAATLVRPLAAAADRTLLHIRPLTGRRHQIRAQLAHAGFPVLGDVKYGVARQGQLMLHAMRAILPDQTEFACMPQWEEALMPQTMPTPLVDNPETAFPISKSASLPAFSTQSFQE